MTETTITNSSACNYRKHLVLSHVIRNGILGLIIFITTSSLSIYTLQRNNPLFLFLAEEYVELGWNYYQFGNFYGSIPVKAVFRPPGYSFFCAAVFLVSDGNPGGKTPFTDMVKNIPQREKVFTALERSQALMLGLSAVLIFAIVSQYLDRVKAVILSLLFGCNPYTVMLTGLYHYDIVHIFATLLATWLLSTAATSQNTYSKAWLLASGIAWGVATLIRPITLILPLFMLFFFLYESRWLFKKSLLKTALFSLGMFLVITPWTIRNYSLSNKIIPVNAQTGIAFWAATSKVNEIHPNHYGWMNIWYPDGDAIYKRITGYTYKSNAQYAIFSLQMEEEFKRITMQNISTQPLVYVRNILANMALFIFNMNDVLIKIYQAFQNQSITTDAWTEWITPGNPQTFQSSREQHSFYIFTITLTVLSAAAIINAIKKRAIPVIAIAMIFVCIGTAYSISYLDLMYYSIKIPFLFLLSGYFLSTISSRKISAVYLGRLQNISMASIVLCVLTAWSGWLAINVLFSP